MSGDFLTIAAALAADLLDLDDRFEVRTMADVVTGGAARAGCDSDRGQAIEMAGRLTADMSSMATAAAVAVLAVSDLVATTRF
jgi:hypothetical protein